ncbi:MAG: UDP-glucose 4-epimerase GalE [Candidatus Gracilibacteria bacterium]
MSEILVTGGAGYIGSNVVKLLIDSGFEVIIVDDLSTGNEALVHPRAKFYKGSILDSDFLRMVFSRHKFLCVFHFAAFSVVSESGLNPEKYENNNVNGGKMLLEAMLSAGCNKMIFSSTASVYGAPKKLPIEENHPLNPVSVYGKTKVMFEKMLTEYSENHGLEFIAFRYFNAGGSSDDLRFGEMHEPETHLIRSVFKRLMAGESVKVFGTNYDTFDGTCIRDYLHVTDIARAHILGMEYLQKKASQSQFINLGTERGHSVLEIIDLCAKVSGISAKIQVEPARDGDVPALLASCKKARDLLGFVPQKTIDDIIQSAFEFEKAQPNK